MEYYLPSTRNSEDRTREIEDLLQRFGACALGPGTYVVKNLKMPDGTMLRGEGSATKLLLHPEGSFTVQLGSFCTVRDLMVLGSEEPIELPDAVGDRHGLLFLGNATPEDYHTQPRNSIISGCFASGFTGGGLTCHDTGYSTVCSLTVSDCHIWNCGAGINISHFSEYHEFTNVLCSANRYGCINNGGNNVFVNCGFNSNITGFLIDNSRGQSNNNSHGSAIGCTFNHSDKNKGIGIQILGATSGYVFTGCQVFFSRIILENSHGILFDNLNCGRMVSVSVKGGSSTIFSTSHFLNDLEYHVEDNSLVKFLHCYTRDGRKVGL